MARIGFDSRGYAFKSGLYVLREGYNSASASLKADVERLSAEAAAYESSEEWIGERDEDGYVLWDQDQILDMHRETSEEALMALRKAIIVSLYHHWERAIRAYTKSSRHLNHVQLTERANMRGITLHARLDAVRDLTNALKHDKGKPLQQSWPAVLNEYARSHEPRDWYKAIRLEDAHIVEAFEIVAQSGPAVWF